MPLSYQWIRSTSFNKSFLLQARRQWKTCKNIALCSATFLVSVALILWSPRAFKKLHVYLGDPDYPLSMTETREIIRELGESTVLTARIILGLWNIQRCDQ